MSNTQTKKLTNIQNKLNDKIVEADEIMKDAKAEPYLSFVPLLLTTRLETCIAEAVQLNALVGFHITNGDPSQIAEHEVNSKKIVQELEKFTKNVKDNILQYDDLQGPPAKKQKGDGEKEPGSQGPPAIEKKCDGETRAGAGSQGSPANGAGSQGSPANEKGEEKDDPETGGKGETKAGGKGETKAGVKAESKTSGKGEPKAAGKGETKAGGKGGGKKG